MNINKIKNYKNWSLPVKAAFWFIVVSLVQKAFSFITVPIFTRVMTQEQYGLYSTYLSITNIVTVFLTLNLDSGAYSNVMGKEKNEKVKNETTISYATLSFVITTFFGIFAIIFIDKIATFFKISEFMIILMLIEIYTFPIIKFWTFQQRFKYKYKSLIIYTLITSIVNVVLGILLVLNVDIGQQAVGRIASVIIVQIISAILFYIYFAIKTKKLFSTLKWGETLKFQLPLIPYYLSMNFLLSSDLVMIRSMVGSAEAACYSVAYSIGQVMIILKQAIIDAVRPWIYEKLNNKDYEQISKVSNILIILVVLLSILLSEIAPELVLIIASNKYSEAIYVIPPVALSSMFTFLYQLFVIIETYYKKTTKIMIASVIAAIINLILNYICIPIFGYIVAGYTTLVSYIILSILHYINVRKIEKEEFENKRIFDIKKITIISIISIVLCILVSLLYKNAPLRYGVLIGTTIIIICNKNNIEKVYKKIKKK